MKMIGYITCCLVSVFLYSNLWALPNKSKRNTREVIHEVPHEVAHKEKAMHQLVKSSQNEKVSQNETATDIDHIVAVVNDEVITQSELDHAVAMVKIQMEQTPVPNPPSDEELQQKMLDQMINKKLELQLAKQANIHIDDTEIDDAVKNIAEQNNVPVDELYDHVKQQGLSKEDYRDELQDQIVIQKIQQAEVASHVSISRDELKRFIKNRTWEQDIPVEKEYQVEDILVPLSDNASKEDINHAKIHAFTLLAELKRKHTTYQVNNDESVSVTDFGFKRLTQLPSVFASEIPNLHPNDLAGPIQTGNGFHIIRLAAERALGGKKPDEPTKKQLEQLLFQHKFEEAMQTWLSKLRSQAFIITNLAPSP